MAPDVVRQIRKATRSRFPAEEKIRIVLERLRGEIGSLSVGTMLGTMACGDGESN